MNNEMAFLGDISVLMGGCSSEREISLKSGEAVYKALQEAGAHVQPLDIRTRDPQAILTSIQQANMDVAFIALHGQMGEDGIIQSVLEQAEIPYTGSGVEASQRALQKDVSYQIFQDHQIQVPKHVILNQMNSLNETQITSQLFWPVMVKPTNEGSSLGIHLVKDYASLAPALSKAFRYSPSVLVEQYIPGREMTVGILDERALPIVEIRTSNHFFDFQAKYQSGMTEYIVPADVPESLSQKIQHMALEAHRALGCRDFSRADFMLDRDLTPYLLEVNTIPGFTATSLLPKAAQAAGMNFIQLCTNIIQLAYEKTKQKQI